MKKLIKSENLEDKFLWQQAVSNNELYKFFSASDIAVWPRECSIGMLEAMACCLPVIISDSSEVNERVLYGNGITYHNDDPTDLAIKMERLLEVELRKNMGANGRKLIEQHLNWKTIAQQFIEPFEDLSYKL